MSADAKREAAVDGFASMTLEAGGRLGRYRILGLLGRGGMADVYRAEDERLGREVALKLVPPEFARDPDRVERFEREVRAAAKLTHANIVTLFEFDQEGEQPFYTMALMRGGDLKARIRAHPEGMPPEEAREIALAVARALAYAHGEGFVHRDVKPENILFGQDGVPQLTDFGIARAMSSGTRMTATGMSIGSPHYMSPEQARGRAVDGRSDLYSLGVVLHEMLTGRVPFDAADTLAVALRHLNDPVPALPGHLAEWQPLLDRLLAKSPEDRYGSVRELTEALASGALPHVSETRAGGVLETPLSAGTRVISREGEVGPTAAAKEFVPGAVEASPPRHGLLAVAAGEVLALAVVGVLYSMSRQDPDRLSSGDGGGAAGARAGRSPNSSPPAGSDDRNRRDSAAETPVSRLAALEEQALDLDRAAREEVQAGLMASGFDPGEPNGVFSATTRAALREWQGVRGRPTTGYLDAESAGVLRAAGEAEGLRREAAARREAEREAAARREAEREAAARLEAEREAAARREAEREAAARREAEREVAREVVFLEDFESYAVGSRPRDYVIVHNGEGDRAQRVSAEQNNRYLRTAGQRSWSLNMRKDFAFDLPRAISVSGRIRINKDLRRYGYDRGGAEYGHFGGFGVKNSDHLTASFSLRKLRSDQKIYAACPGGTEDGSYGREVPLDEWVEFQLDIDFVARNYAIHVDGVRFCETRTGQADLSGRWNSWGTSSGIHYSSGNSDPTETFFDDIEIRARTRQ